MFRVCQAETTDAGGVTQTFKGISIAWKQLRVVEYYKQQEFIDSTYDESVR